MSVLLFKNTERKKFENRRVVKMERNKNEEDNPDFEAKRREELKKYYSKNRNEEDNATGNVISYILLVFLDILLLNIVVLINFKIFESSMSYPEEWLIVIILWIISCLILAFFFYTVKQTIKYLKKL